MKVAIIGASGHASFILDGLSSQDVRQATLVGLAPASPGESVAKLAQACLGRGWRPALYDDYRLMLDQQQPDVVAVNPYFCDHEKIALELFARGIHAFVEKPLALSLQGLTRLREAHARAGVELGCMLNMRYEPAIHAAWQAVRAGAIGEVRLVQAQKSYKLGQRPDFYKRRATFGGLIPWVGSHAIDLIALFSGEQFLSVYAKQSCRGNQGNGELEVSASCLFEMTNGVIGLASIDYLRPASAPTHGDDRVRVVGVAGVMEVRDGKALLTDAQGLREQPLEAPRSIFADFLDQVRGTGPGLVSAEEAFVNTRSSLLAQQSADCSKVFSFID